jgi:hypothetical protein
MEKLLDRLMLIFGTLFSSHLETMILLRQADHQDALEERARRLEAEGKLELARTLRSRAARIAPENPASAALLAIQNLQAKDEASGVPLLEPIDGNKETSGHGALPKPRGRAPRAPWKNTPSQEGR